MILTAEPNKQEIFISRNFKAPVEKVFEAFTNKEILIQFFAPKGINMEFLSEQYKEGFAYRYRHTNGKGEIYCTFKGVVHETVAPNRLVITTEMEELPGSHPVLEIYEFEEVTANETKLTIQSICRSVADRDEMIRGGGMEKGVISIFENLDELLVELYGK